jgi:L-amino acid N-acyltransferase
MAQSNTPQSHTFVYCSYEQHASQILHILNDAIIHSTALYDYKPRAFESMQPWFKAKQDHDFPVIGAVDADGVLLGFASYGTFRAWPSYKYTVEHSVYVHKDHRGRGLGLQLMLQLITDARKNQVHVLVGGIDIDNTNSVSLHEKLGFRHAGTIEQAAYKFGRWLNLGFYQLTLDTPDHPIED